MTCPSQFYIFICYVTFVFILIFVSILGFIGRSKYSCILEDNNRAYMSILVRTTRSWNNLHQVHSSQKVRKLNSLKVFGGKWIHVIKQMEQWDGQNILTVTGIKGDG